MCAVTPPFSVAHPETNMAVKIVVNAIIAKPFLVFMKNSFAGGAFYQIQGLLATNADDFSLTDSTASGV